MKNIRNTTGSETCRRGRIARKLADRRGATIIFALFMFLLCAAVGSVVLASGTAAAGRKAQIAEMDQRYYAVQSAAELVRGEIESQSVTVERKQEKHYLYEYTLWRDPETMISVRHDFPDPDLEPYDTEYKIEYNGTEDISSNPPMLVKFLSDYLGDDAQAIYELEKGDKALSSVFAAEIEQKFRLTYDGDGTKMGKTDGTEGTFDYLTVDITVTTNASGDLTVKFSSQEDPETGGVYTLIQTYTVEIRETSSTETQNADSVITPISGEEDHFKEEVESTVSEVKTAVFRWRFNGSAVESAA